MVGAYERITAIAREGKTALLRADWSRLGALMNENHAIQRGLGGSGESNERLIAAALGAGALGAKLAGAGGGGTIVALWTHADAAPLESALRAAGATALLSARAGVRRARRSRSSERPKEEPWPTRPCSPKRATACSP